MKKQDVILGRQVRAARALLNWSQQMLADEASLSITPITRLENEMVDSRGSTLVLVRQALERAGIEFVNEKNQVGVILTVAEEE